ncbi:anthranilate/para-aminobenzoate synthase component I [secondary endosymbiont of Heteropsylla cubana]|uniref:Anthranilate/para-aminobenzoate synthase component I n=1 Tax=secondary endosymbiont of Heteropsylla cubana TaxID=134287 RepID=J3YTN6_9ENTR|nr:anthranilate/para-aminobenzoate synthase component I [secondary endosymbiont of Heteropsylla cubana]
MKLGVVRVLVLFKIKIFIVMHHTVNTIGTFLKEEYNLFDLLCVYFSGYSISGIPKVRSI